MKRRHLLASLPAVAVAGTATTAAAAALADQDADAALFTLIERYKRFSAEIAEGVLHRDPKGDLLDSAMNRLDNLECDIARIVPNTLAGVLVQVELLNLRDDDGYKYRTIVDDAQDQITVSIETALRRLVEA